MKKSILQIVILILFFSSGLRSQWQYFNLGSNNSLGEIYFTNYNTGYTACYPGKIFKTTNAGENWQVVFNQIFGNFSDVEFINDSTGFFSSRRLLKTTNSGLNWEIFNFGDYTLSSINFINQNTGFLSARDPGKIFKSTNSGENWIELNYNFEFDLYDVQFLDIETGFVCGHPLSQIRGYIAKTTDGGSTWRTWWNSSTVNNSLSFINSQTGYVAEYRGTLFKTTNGGQDPFWSAIYIFPENVSEIQAIDENIIYECGTNGFIGRSSNGGYNWERMNSQTTQHLFGMHFLNKDTGYVCGDSGVVLRITNASTVGINQISSEVPTEYKLYQNYPNPFNPNTVIHYELLTPLNPPFSKGGNGGFVTLKVFDCLGKEVATLVDQKQNAGRYEVEFNAVSLTSGIYFYSLKTGNYEATKKMVLIK